MTFETLYPRNITRQYQYADVHGALFLPADWPGHGNMVSMLIPECETQYVMCRGDKPPIAVINRPQNHRGIEHWLDCICEMAPELKAGISIACDTADQVQAAVKMIGARVPNYRRAELDPYGSDVRPVNVPYH